MPLRLSGLKYKLRYWLIYLPSRSPISRIRNSAQRSIKPFPVGVPVSPTMRFTFGRMAFMARNRFDWWFLKLDSSSRTTISKSRRLFS